MSHYPQVNGPDPELNDTLAAMLAALRDRHNDAICAMLVYGSCLRSGDIYDGLLDLYLICDDYHSAYPKALPAAANWLLPPNVFYAEQPPMTAGGQTLRAKVTVISLPDFQHGCSTRWFESYIWGRFAQPTHVLYARDAQTRAGVEWALLEAARTLLRRAVPALSGQGTLTQLWEQSLGLSYATELRTERSGRAAELASSALEFYTQVTLVHKDSLGFPFSVEQVAQDFRYQSDPGGRRRLLSRLGWATRRIQGKFLSITRLLKALFTFEGGLDYIAWKLERHSGEKVEIPDRVRRAPLIYLWGFFWGLYRRGIFK
ncbi:MAG: hypothetical protein ACI9NT_001067 [Bacteroidia bacterium]